MQAMEVRPEANGSFRRPTSTGARRRRGNSRHRFVAGIAGPGSGPGQAAARAGCSRKGFVERDGAGGYRIAATWSGAPDGADSADDRDRQLDGLRFPQLVFTLSGRIRRHSA